MSDRKVYSGSKRRLVLALDLGTTFSGVSFAFLDPGKVPKVHTVSRYPGQEAGDAKIPTVIYYDRHGHVLGAGAEEPQPGDDDSEDEWEDEPIKLEWFKLLLRPQSTTQADSMPAPRLPASKTIIDVYADFYRYLFSCARAYIQQTFAALGGLVWDSVEDSIDFVLTHPNGWGGSQQNAMRRAAIQAGLVPDITSGYARINFASEGEASLHYCLNSGLVSADVEVGKKVMVIDAGGGTVDISTYVFTSASPIQAEEIAIPACVFEGSVIVRHRAEAHIRAKLRNSAKFSEEAYVQAIVQEFDKTAKKRFKGIADASVRFSNLIADRDPTVNIRNGTIKLTKDELCRFFDPGVAAIGETVRSQRLAASDRGEDIKTYFLVGGFAASEYLFERLKSQSESAGCVLYRPDTHTNKAVAEGAVSFHVDHFVATRVARFTYGTDSTTEFDANRRSHAARSHLAYTGVEGYLKIPDAFNPILRKGTSVQETTEFRETFNYSQKKLPKDNKVSATIFAHPADSKTGIPEFMDDSFSSLCEVSGVLHDVPSSHRRRADGEYYYQQEVDVVLSFGLTELKAQLAWNANGVEQRSPATIVFDDDFAVTVAGT